MPWVKLDDKFPDHPKVDGLTDSAFRLHVCGLCHCARYLTDGIIPGDRVPRLVPRYRQKSLDELIRRGLWTALNGGYSIHGFTEWNKSREWWEAERLKKADRVAKWRATHRDESGQFYAE